ncbi:MAG: hypothetical protein HY833_00200 [Candidatus Aenigmarchaeota archaeon]|nr:hypothetical protein [Candidatus Aenigmarchaeota archaeon]
MTQSYEQLTRKLVDTGLRLSYDIADTINSTPRTERVGSMESKLKVGVEAQWAKKSDVMAENIAIRYLRNLSEQIERKIIMVVDPRSGRTFEVGNYTRNDPIYCENDSIDGTKILDGFGNDQERGIYRLGSNGHYGTATAFTMPTKKDVKDVAVGDFEVSVMIEANPTVHRTHPTSAAAWRDEAGDIGTYENNRKYGDFYKLRMSSQTNFSKSVAILDFFSAFDETSAVEGMKELAWNAYKRLSDRNGGGAFDVCRSYALTSDLLAELFERADGNIEPRGTARVSINEHLGNLVPMYPIIRGAGGSIVDFEGNDAGGKKISEKRQNFVASSNDAIKNHILGQLRGI